MKEVNEKWRERIEKHRLIFEVANRALATVTWSSLCAVASFFVVKGYWTPTPALSSMGWTGEIIYSVFAISFTLISLITSGTLLIAMWLLILGLKQDLEHGPNQITGILIATFSKVWHFVFVLFFLVLISILSVQLFSALN